MRKLWCVLLTAALLQGGYALSDELTSETTNIKPKKEKKCFFPKSKKRAPQWVCNAHADGLAIAAVGAAAKSKAGLSFMEQMAIADARKKLAQELHDSKQPKAEENSVASNTASDVTEANESLENTKILKSISGPNGSLYVLVGIDEASN
jgi:hypothetical protein